jgi:uncharacterized membrane protein
MEGFLILCLLVLVIFILVQRTKIVANEKALNRLDSCFQDWASVGNTLHHRVEALRHEVTDLNDRLAKLETSPERPRVPLEAAPPPLTQVVSPVEQPAWRSVKQPTPQPIAQAPVSVVATPLPPKPVEAPSPAPSQPIELPLQEPALQEPALQQPVPQPPREVEVEPESVPTPSPLFDWESLIGVRLFSWIAGVSLLLGAIFFLRYSVESGWLTPPIRMAMGLILGIVLLVACELKGRAYRVTANAMDAAGIGTLFATCFASNSVWHLVPAPVTALLLVLVTILAVLLSLRRDSFFIALLGLLGGFATPILLSTGENRPFGLFGYLLLLNLGLGFLALRKHWPLLLSLSVGFTTLYQWGWLGKFVYHETNQLPLALGIFLLFPSVWLILWGFFRRVATKELTACVELTLLAALGVPLLLAVVMAWVPAFGERWELLFGYLFVLDAGLLVLHAHRPEFKMGGVAGGVTLLVWGSWLSYSYAESYAWPWLCVPLVLFVLLFLTPRWFAKKLGWAVPESSQFIELTAPALLFVLPVLTLIEPGAQNPFIVFGTLLLLLLVLGAAAIYHRDGWLYYAAVPLAILTEAIWSERYLDPTSLPLGLTIYLVLALTFVGTPLIATRLARELRPTWAAAAIPLLNLLLLPFFSVGEIASHGLWALGLMLLVLNLGLIVQARNDRRPWLVWVGLVVSWLVLVLWWNQAITQASLLAALVVIFGMVVVSVVGLFWLSQGLPEDNAQKPSSLTDKGPLWGLVGHLFLLYVATQPHLNTPPWSLFGVLLVLDLAMLAASLYLRQVLVGALGLAMSVLLLGIFSIAAPFGTELVNAAEVALLGGVILLALSYGLVRLAKRRGCELAPFERSHALMLLFILGLLGQLGALKDSPRFLLLLGTEATILGWLLVMGRNQGWHLFVLAGAIISSMGQVVWAGQHFSSDQAGHQLILGFVPYLLLSGYPVLLGQRTKDSRVPFYIAIFASASFFVAGYCSMKWGPLSAYMGALPLFESLVLAALLFFIVRKLEPTGPRNIGRLALVAAAALAYLTCAIPLQLSNEWLTLGWALEAAALGWLTKRLHHPGSMVGSVALSAAVLVRLVANPAVLAYHLRSDSPFLNFYLYTYLIAATSLYVAAWFLREEKLTRGYEWLEHTVFLQRAGATLLLFVLLNIEIADFYSEGTTITFRFTSTIAQDLTYTLSWALFSIIMLVVGISLGSRGARIAALALLTATIAKCFLHDIWGLGDLYRVGSFVGLALSLAVVAILLQRFVLRSASSKPTP